MVLGFSRTGACLEYYRSQLVLGLGLALRPHTLPLGAALLGAQLQFQLQLLDRLQLRILHEMMQCTNIRHTTDVGCLNVFGFNYNFSYTWNIDLKI